MYKSISLSRIKKHKHKRVKRILFLTMLIILILISIFAVCGTFIKDNALSIMPVTLTGITIVLDPGHGGIDSGAESKTGLLEKDITLNISMYLRDYLCEAGYLVVMTRETDKALAEDSETSNRQRTDLMNRVAIANNSKGELFISIHANSILSEEWRGAQTFYNSTREENEIIAEYIQEQLILTLGNTDRLHLPMDEIRVLKYVEMPSAMVEVGFLSNPVEAELLGTTKYQKKIAYAIYQGIEVYYVETKSVSDNDY